MLSFSLLSNPFCSPPKSLHSRTVHHLPTSKNPILIGNIRSKRHLGGGIGRIKVSGQRNMAELVGVDAFGKSGGSEEEDDLIVRQEVSLEGFESKLNRMSKWIVAILFGLFILWKHDAEAMWLTTGAIINSWISTTLKKILNHQRPVSALRSDPGMPSSHAQSLFFTAFFVILSLFHWRGMNVGTMIVGIVTLVCGSYFSWLRVSQQLHTISQVVVGAVLGSACSIAWFWMWHSFVLAAFISFIWVRIIVVLGSLLFCALFLRYVIQHWLIDEQ